MTALEFVRRFPELEYMASMVGAYCQGPVESIAPRVHAAPIQDSRLLGEIAMRLIANGAHDLRLLGSNAEQFFNENPEEATKLDKFLRAILPVRG